MEKFIVYCTTNIVNNKIYIGVHKTKKESFDGYIGCGVYITSPHTYELTKTVFQRAVKKYGPKNFIRKTIKEFDCEEDAYALEEDIVNETFLKRNDVYNTVIGGSGGDRGINAKPCYQYDLQGNYIAEFKNRQDAARFVNRGFTTIKRAISDKIPAAEYFWSDEKVDKLDLNNYKTTTNRIPIFQYSLSGEYDCCYESIADAARCNNISSSQISKAAKLGYVLKDKYYSYEFESAFDKAKFNYLYEIPIYMYNIQGNFIKSFINIKEAKKELKTKSDLYKYIKLNKVFKDTYQFSFEKLKQMSDRNIKKPSKRKIGQYDLNNNLIKEYDTISECVKLFGTGVKHCLSGRNKTSKGFIYKYLD